MGVEGGPDGRDRGAESHGRERQEESRYPPEHSRVVTSDELLARLHKSSHLRHTHPGADTDWTLEKAIHETVEFLTDHVLVCGCPSSIETFVHTLRPRHIGYSKIMPIVFLNPTPPSEALWAEVAKYPEVYIVLGNPLETRDLVRAGVLTLGRAIILVAGDSLGYDTDGYMRDADALFAYQSIAKVRPNVTIVCEIDDGRNISFLCETDQEMTRPKSSHAGADNVNDNDAEQSFTMEAPFAAGAVYVDSLQDKLAVQVFYNPNLLRIIRELVVGQAEEATYPEPNVTPSHLTFTPVPARFHGKSYIQLFQHLIMTQMAIPLGLYRSAPWGVARGTNLPYVITNPNPDILCQADDFVYTLDSMSPLDSHLHVTVRRGYHFGLIQTKGAMSSFGNERKIPYVCNITVNGMHYCTEPERDNNPEWNHVFSFRVPELPFPITISVVISNAEGFKEEIALGDVVLDMKNFGIGGSRLVWVPIQSKEDRAAKANDSQYAHHSEQLEAMNLLADEDEDVETKIISEQDALESKCPGVMVYVMHVPNGDQDAEESQHLIKNMSSDSTFQNGHRQSDGVDTARSESHAAQVIMLDEFIGSVKSVPGSQTAEVNDLQGADSHTVVKLQTDGSQDPSTYESFQSLREPTPRYADQDLTARFATSHFNAGDMGEKRERKYKERGAEEGLGKQRMLKQRYDRPNRQSAISSLDAAIQKLDESPDPSTHTIRSLSVRTGRARQESRAPADPMKKRGGKRRTRGGASDIAAGSDSARDPWDSVGLSSRDSAAGSMASGSHMNYYMRENDNASRMQEFDPSMAPMSSVEISTNVSHSMSLSKQTEGHKAGSNGVRKHKLRTARAPVRPGAPRGNGLIDTLPPSSVNSLELSRGPAPSPASKFPANGARVAADTGFLSGRAPQRP